MFSHTSTNKNKLKPYKKKMNKSKPLNIKVRELPLLLYL